MQRWKELPNPADFASELGLNMPKYELEREETIKLTKSAFMLENAPLINIIEEWRSKWKLGSYCSCFSMTLSIVFLFF